MVFDYRTAFSRNIGWITEQEQQELRKKTVAIAGMGGVGGAHALTLSRLGIGGLRIADADKFDIANLNRQAGAFLSTMNLQKTAVMARMTRDVNPDLRLKTFGKIEESNLDEFLSGADLFVDGFDFFVLDIRRKAFARCAELGIPAITAGPIGFGASYLIFMPGGMNFEEYFRFEGLSQNQQYVNFALGLTPKGLHRPYLIDPSRVDLAGHRGPSSAAAIQLCSGIVGAEAVKILLGRGEVHPAPAYHQFDAYRGRFVRGSLPWGNAGPLQSLKRRIGYKAFEKLSRKARPAEEPVAGSEIERILDLTRWAPSGDNTQPWRFKITGPETLIITLHAEGEKANIYDFAQGQPTILSGGFLLETLRIAASRFGRAMRWSYGGGEITPEGGVRHRIEVALPEDASVTADPLHHYIPIRSVDRRPYRRTPLTQQQKLALQSTLGADLHIRWVEGFGERLRFARLNAAASDIRLRLREAYEIHKRILNWDRPFSEAGVPVAAVGADFLTVRLMRFVMRDWRRIDFMNRFLLGTAIPRLELDLLPGIACAAHFVVSRTSVPETDDAIPALLRTGAALQRFWLAATDMGLAVQPTLAPLCFTYYGQRADGAGLAPRIARFPAKAAACFATDGSVLFLGRIGTPPRKVLAARSLRRKVGELTDDLGGRLAG
jgi:molybdopterin/thiamine biosynthesis adenylyltransferase